MQLFDISMMGSVHLDRECPEGKLHLHSFYGITSSHPCAHPVVVNGDSSCHPSHCNTTAPNRGRETKLLTPQWPEWHQNPTLNGVNSTKGQRLKIGKRQLFKGKYGGYWQKTGTKVPPTWKPPISAPHNLSMISQSARLLTALPLPCQPPLMPRKAPPLGQPSPLLSRTVSLVEGTFP